MLNIHGKIIFIMSELDDPQSCQSCQSWPWLGPCKNHIMSFACHYALCISNEMKARETYHFESPKILHMSSYDNVLCAVDDVVYAVRTKRNHVIVLCGSNTSQVGCPVVPHETKGRVSCSQAIHHTHLVFLGFNHFWPLHFLNWSFLWFWKSIPHGQKAYHMVTKQTT